MFNVFKKSNINNDNKFKDSSIEYIIVGLGNPGKNYENTRHNVGFMVIDYIANKLSISVDKLKFKSLCKNVKINGKSCLLMKPQTFMNNSGQAVTEAMNFYKVKPENVLVIYDDISLEPGKLRIKRKGSHGGHNGIKNIIYLANDENFLRIKVGVGKKPNPNWDLADWVLSKFSSDDIKKLDLIIEDIYSSVELIVSNKIDEAMNKYNS